jgi:SagB-type dehydrogenase family enzyme
MRIDARIWIVPLLAGSMFAPSSCRRAAPPDTQDAEPSVLSLDRLSFAQLRVFLRGHASDWRRHPDSARGLPPPPAMRPLPPGATVIDLPAPETLALGRVPFRDVVDRRRSRRSTTADPLTLEELSYLLWCTQGVQAVTTNGAGRVVQSFRTVPSGGARHPFETYLVVARVAGLDPGVYRFLPFDHQLARVRALADPAGQACRACYGQEFVNDAAVCVVWAAVPYRTEWRYAYLAHRMIAIEAGHVCQNLYLAAESIGAGACAVLGYEQQAMDALLGVDGRDEFTIYLATVGRIDSGAEGDP